METKLPNVKTATPMPQVKAPKGSKSSLNALLSAETMKNLGFTEHWPGGNPDEPWWKNPEGIDFGHVWIVELLPRVEFWEMIAEEFREQGRKEVREHLRRALGR